MNNIEKHIHNLSLTFNKNINVNINNRYNSNKKLYNKNNMNNNKNMNNNNFNAINQEEEIILKRPYTAHGYKVKSKTKRLTKTVRNKNENKIEEEKIMAFKEKVFVHDKILSLYNNFLIRDNDKEDEKKKLFSKTHKPRSNTKHYMMPKQKDIIKQNKMKKKEIIYYNDKPEEDPDEIKLEEKEENEIKNKNAKTIKLIRSSNKIFNKSQQALSDLKDILTKENIDTFMENFALKNKNNNIKREEESKNYENVYYSPDKSIIKYYHGGRIYIRPKSMYEKNKIIHNNSDDNLMKMNNKKYKILNPNEIIENPKNNFNFFSQTFTKQPIYGKYYCPPQVEDSINNNLSYIESNKWNGRYKIKKYIYEEKENPNDVYNYDYKYDDLNDDSDNELPSTNFKARKIPKYKKVNVEYKDYKTGKIKGGKIKNQNENNEFQDNGNYNKNIFHPFLINDDAVNL